MDTKISIVSDSTLSKFVCANCYNYLSVGPIGVESDRLICGRCPHTHVNVTLDEADMSKKLFRCVNRFDGCRKLLRYSDVKQHELECLSEENTSYCFLCPFSGNLCQLYNHLRENHGVMDFLFSFKIDFRKTSFKLFRHNDFLVVVKSEPGERKLRFKVMNYGKRNTKNPLSYQLKLKNPQGFKKIYNFPKKNCPVGNRFEENYSEKDNIIDNNDIERYLDIKSLNNIICQVDLFEENSSPCYFELGDLLDFAEMKIKLDHSEREDRVSKNYGFLQTTRKCTLDSSTQTVSSNVNDIVTTNECKVSRRDNSSQTITKPTSNFSTQTLSPNENERLEKDKVCKKDTGSQTVRELKSESSTRTISKDNFTQSTDSATQTPNSEFAVFGRHHAGFATGEIETAVEVVHTCVTTNSKKNQSKFSNSFFSKIFR